MSTFLLNDFRAAGDEVIADGRAVRLILNTDVDDAVQGDAVKRQAVVGSRRSRTLRMRGTRGQRQNAQQKTRLEHAQAALVATSCPISKRSQFRIVHGSSP